MARWGDLHFRKSLDFRDLRSFGQQKYEILSEMGPYGSVGAHIKTGRSSMAQDHLKTPPDPKKCHGMTKNPQKSKKSSRVGQAAIICRFSLVGLLIQYSRS